MKISHALHDWWIKERWIFYPFPNTRYYTFFIALFQLIDMSAVCALLNLYGSRRRFPPWTELASARSPNPYPQYKVKDVKWAIEKQSRNWSSMTISFCSWNPLFSIFYFGKSLNLASSYEDTICFTNDRGWCLLQKAKKMIYLTNLTVFLNQKFKCWLFVWNDSLCISWLQTGAHQRDFDQGANQDSLQCQRWRHQSHTASTKRSKVRSDKYFLFYHSI